MNQHTPKQKWMNKSLCDPTTPSLIQIDHVRFALFIFVHMDRHDRTDGFRYINLFRKALVNW